MTDAANPPAASPAAPMTDAELAELTQWVDSWKRDKELGFPNVVRSVGRLLAEREALLRQQTDDASRFLAERTRARTAESRLAALQRVADAAVAVINGPDTPMYEYAGKRDRNLYDALRAAGYLNQPGTGRSTG